MKKKLNTNELRKIFSSDDNKLMDVQENPDYINKLELTFGDEKKEKFKAKPKKYKNLLRSIVPQENEED